MGVADVRRRFGTVGVEELFGLLLLLGLLAAVGHLVWLLLTAQLSPATLTTFLWRGTVDGLVFGLAAIGLSMTYSILRFANFSHGDLVTTGAFSGWTVAYLLGGSAALAPLFRPDVVADLSSRLLLRADGGASPGTMQMDVVRQPLAIGLGLVAAALVSVAVALAIDRFVYRKMRTESSISLLIASVGVAFVLRYLLAFVYSTSTRGVVASADPVVIGPASWGLRIDDPHEVTMVVAAVAMMLGVHVLLQHTKLGTAMRAMADNRDLALITGIPTERVVRWTWIVGAAFAGAAGYLIVLNIGTIHYNLGWFFLLVIFSAVILGGIGSIYGAILGGLIIGIVMNVSLVWIPSDMNEVAAFTIMILILIFRPDGLLGGVRTA